MANMGPSPVLQHRFAWPSSHVAQRSAMRSFNRLSPRLRQNQKQPYATSAHHVPDTVSSTTNTLSPYDSTASQPLRAKRPYSCSQGSSQHQFQTQSQDQSQALPRHLPCDRPPQSPTLSRRSVLHAAALATAASTLGPMVFTSPASAAALSGRSPPDLGFVSRVTEFTLPNGLHVITLPRRNAPVVACHTLANVGAWQEAPGVTGLAHLLEHMAFKGTPRLGSLDFSREAPLLDALDEAFNELRDAKAAAASAPRLSQLRSQLRSLQEEADRLTVPNAFGAALSAAGGVGLNATTSHDSTRYYVSLPSNKLELWVALEAERFRAPVFRGLYSEKPVIEEERRLRVENTPMGRYQQDFALNALANNYRRPVIGFEKDFDAIGRREVQAFFNAFYGPANLTLAVVGDVDPEVLHRMVERYWGDWSGPEGYQVLPQGQPLMAAGNAAVEERVEQPGRGTAGAGSAAVARGEWGDGEEDPRPQSFLSGSRTSMTGAASSGPLVLLGYYRPPLSSRSGVVLEVLADVLAGGRTSRLVSQLVLSGRALNAAIVSGYPGERHAGMALVYGMPKKGDSPEDIAGMLQSQLAAVVADGVNPDELERVRRASRAGLLAAAQSNSAMAASLASYHVATGSWRGLVDELEVVGALGGEEVRTVAERVFAPNNCFTGYVLST